MEMKNWITEHQDGLLDDLLSVLAIESVEGEPLPGMPNGKAVNEALERMLGIGRSHGFRTGNIDGHAGYIEYGEGDDYVGVLGHLDIVPVGTGWTRNPLGEVHGDSVYGRGTMDDKGPMVASLHGLIALRESGLPLKHRIRLIFGTSEETGGPDIHTYLSKEKPPVAGFTPDADFPAINAEMGILIFSLEKHLPGTDLLEAEGGTAVNMVPAQASMRIRENGGEVTLKAEGVSAHGSTPEKGENAIWKLVDEALSRDLDPALKETLRLIQYNLCQDTDGKALGVDLSDDESGKLVQNFGLLSFKEEVLKLGINIRYPVTFRADDVLLKVRDVFEKEGFTFTLEAHNEPLFYPKDNDLIQKLMGVYHEVTGDTSGPLAIGGGTYAKEMPNIVAFGPQLPGRRDTVHQADESITIADLLLCAEIYARAMYELARA